MIEVVRATVDLGREVLANAREPERRTIERFNIKAGYLLESTIEQSQNSYVALVDGVPACAWGIDSVTLLGDQKMWMITTPLVEDHPVAFLRMSRAFVEAARAKLGPIEGAVDSENEISLRWLRWIGFRVVEDGPIKKMRYD